MKRTSFALGAILVVLSPVTALAQHAPSTVEELKREVQRLEQDPAPASSALMIARARLALLEGKPKAAVIEGRVLLRESEIRLKAVQKLLTQGRLCSEDPLREAQGTMAIARALLAEAEGRRDDLRTELPRVITYHEWSISRLKHLERVVPRSVAAEDLKQPERELSLARQQLAGLRGDPSKQNKPVKRPSP